MVQHPSIAPPFLTAETRVDCNGKRGFTQVDMLYREHIDDIDPQSLQSYSRGSTEPPSDPSGGQSSLSIGGSQIVRTPTLQV